jgi:hypothetical protein
MTCSTVISRPTIARPSLLAGDRESLGQPSRPLERVGLWLSRAVGPLIPANYRPIAAEDVARALLDRTPESEGRGVVVVGEHGAIG